jgi:uncharacterized protein (TIGR00299 family) protein
MMNNAILYIEATSGISGDMLLGALLDLGVPIEALNETWTSLGLDNYEVQIFETRKSGLRALQCSVKTEEAKGPRTWKDYERILKRASLKHNLRSDTLRLCKRIFEVEAAFHGESLDRLHLHEMGGTDLLIDVTGVLAALEYLKPAKIHSSPINTGRGFIKFSHGVYPVPAPATSKLLEGIPVFQNDVEGELCTPTGALLITHLATKFGSMPMMTLERIGIGAGERDTAPHPNVLRIFQGKASTCEAYEDILMLESNIDDSTPQVLAYFMEKAFEVGALDVFFTPVFMKKNRPAVRLSIIADASNFDEIVKLLFQETTAIGLRYWKVDRKKLDRRWKEVRVRNTTIRIKEGFLGNVLYNYQPEFEDCRKAGENQKRPVKEIMAEAVSAYLNTGKKIKVQRSRKSAKKT